MKTKGMVAAVVFLFCACLCCVSTGNGEQTADPGKGDGPRALAGRGPENGQAEGGAGGLPEHNENGKEPRAQAGGKSPEGAGTPRASDTAAFDRYVESGWDSPFGLDYVFVLDPGGRDAELVQSFSETVGVRWVNFARVKWDLIEKRAPVGGRHLYDWSVLDEAVRQWQQYGVHIVMTLRLHCRWATAPKRDDVFVYLKGPLKWAAKKTADYLPKPQHMKSFRDFIFSLVERYDGDGHEDMPGLRFPVLHYQLGNEYYNELYWAGTAEEYGRLLEEGTRAARLACKNVKILLSGVGFWEVFGFYDKEMDPLTKAYVEEKLPEVPEGIQRFLKRATAFSQRTITYCDAYDILDARWPNFGFVSHCAELLKQAGCSGKEIWSAEIYSYYPLYEGMMIPNWSIQPYPVTSKSQEYSKILRKKNDTDFPKVNGWYRALQAAQVVKDCMVALDAGSKKLMIGFPGDIQSILIPYNLHITGLASGTFRKLWPAAYAYKQVIEKLDGFRSIRRLALPENVYVYECTVKNDRKVLVAFYDDHVGQDLDEPLGSVAASIPFTSGRVKLTHTITGIDQQEAEVQRLKVEGGKLSLNLSEIPVFLESVDE